MPDPGVNVRLTVDEMRALRMAVIFGRPDRPHAVLEGAVDKLKRAEDKASA